jgi:hypothetical protein
MRARRKLTPVDPEGGAIVVSRETYRATDGHGSPRRTADAQEIAVWKKGCEPTTVRLAVGQPIPRPLVVAFQRTSQTGE